MIGPCIRHIFCGKNNVPLPLIREKQVVIYWQTKEWVLRYSELSPGGLSRNSVVIYLSANMTSAVYRGSKALK